jgi:hypothetical protein
MKTLKALLVFLGIFFGTLQAQTGFHSYTFTTTGRDPSPSGIISIAGTGIGYSKLTWTTSGTVSGAVQLDSSSDGVTWTAGGAISTQTFTSAGQTSYTSGVFNYLAINMTTLTGGGSVTVTWNGSTFNPGGGSGTVSSVGIAGTANQIGTSGTCTITSTGTCTLSSLATKLTTGTSVTLTAPRGYFVCTTTCTVTPPVPAAGYEFCVMNDDNVSTVITMAALGSSALYENTARTGYGTAGTGTFVSGGAVGDKICLLGRDATHYLSVSYVGTWIAN